MHSLLTSCSLSLCLLSDLRAREGRNVIRLDCRSYSTSHHNHRSHPPSFGSARDQLQRSTLQVATALLGLWTGYRIQYLQWSIQALEGSHSLIHTMFTPPTLLAGAAAALVASSSVAALPHFLDPRVGAYPHYIDPAHSFAITDVTSTCHTYRHLTSARSWRLNQIMSFARMIQQAMDQWRLPTEMEREPMRRR